MISVEDLKAELRIPLANVASDELLERLEAEAVERVQLHTGRYYGAVEETTEYVRGTGSNVLWLKETPATGEDLTVEVVERYDAGDDGTAIVMDDDSGFVSRGTRLIRKNGVWLYGYEYAVTYTRGYAAGAEPVDVRNKVKGLVVLWYTTRLPTPERDAAERTLLGPVAPRV